MTWMPFICLGAGLVIGLFRLPALFLKVVDAVINAALIVLMITIGMNIGTDKAVMGQLGTIGLGCAVIALSAMACSILLTLLAEKTILPLAAIKEKLLAENVQSEAVSQAEQAGAEKQKASPLLWIMPVSIIAGVLAGYLLFPGGRPDFLDKSLLFSLILLYTGVGISMGTNRGVFKYVRLLGLRVLTIPLAVLAGSLCGGLLSGLVLGLPAHVSAISAGGMSYYSLTGAYMTQAYGVEAGTYGFLVNVMREFFTVVLMPVLVRISRGSPIAAGAAGCMDTMLVPVTKCVGPELGLVALISGVALTFVVPFLLPLLHAVL